MYFQNVCRALKFYNFYFTESCLQSSPAKSRSIQGCNDYGADVEMDKDESSSHVVVNATSSAENPMQVLEPHIELSDGEIPVTRNSLPHEPVAASDSSKNRKRRRIRVISSSSESDVPSTGSPKKMASKKEARTKKEAGHRIPWTTDELNHMKTYFQKFFQQKKPPDFASIRRAQQCYPVLQSRSLAQIKTRAWYLIKTGR